MRSADTLPALDVLVRQRFDLSWGKARAWIETGKVSVDGVVCRDPRSFPRAGSAITLHMNAPKTGTAQAPFLLQREQVLYSDTQIIVVNKPAGISTVPYERGERGTLEDAVRAYIKGGHLEVVHRLDKETSGVLVFARTADAARHLGQQFRFHTILRRYLAIAQGDVTTQTIRSTLIENRGDGLRGSARPGWRVTEGEGQDAVTHVTRLRELPGGVGETSHATLVECRLETGRTHQIRIHFSEAGHPLLGEKLYIRDYAGALRPAPRVMLHAVELGLIHPVTGAPMRWEQAPPADFETIASGIRTAPLSR